MLTFERMRPEERGACAALAARAFGNYEYFTYYIPNDQRRTRFLSTMLEIEVRINDGPADFFTAKEDGKIVAVAMESKFSSVQLGIRLTNSHRQGSERSPKGGSTVGG